MIVDTPSQSVWMEGEDQKIWRAWSTMISLPAELNVSLLRLLFGSDRKGLQVQELVDDDCFRGIQPHVFDYLNTQLFFPIVVSHSL